LGYEALFGIVNFFLDLSAAAAAAAAAVVEVERQPLHSASPSQLTKALFSSNDAIQ
jgi:hypothetical protein